MAKISTPALTPKMYRHFAVITLVSTLLMAVFSDGESREAVAAEMAARQRQAELQKASQEKYGKPSLIRADEESGGGGGGSGWSDSGGDYGEPMDAAGSRVQRISNFGAAPARADGGYAPEAYAQYGISQAELAQLSPDERAALLARVRAGGMAVDPRERQRQIDALLSSSRNRAGGEFSEIE